MSISFFKRKPLLLLYTAGIILLLAAAWMSWSNQHNKPERVFWSMVNQSLTTSGVTVQATQKGNDADIKQTIQFSLGGRNISHSVTTLSQPGTTVQDEIIATPEVAFTRYLNVKTDQKRPDGTAMDFSKINGVWAKGEGSGRQLLSQDLLGTGLPLGGVAIPMANVTPEMRQKLIQQIKEQGVYKTSFDSAKKEVKDGRSVYIYSVEVQPVLYANMMKSLAKALGLKELDSLNPQDFADKEPFEMLLTVDISARQLVSAEAIGADIKQAYSSYDMPVSVVPPTSTITTAELQKRLTEIQR